MSMSRDVLDQISEHRIVPVASIDDAAHAAPMGDALVAGGLPIAEITLRTDAALAAIATLAKRSNFLVGAGTVLSVEMVQKALDAGAKFIVTPGLNQKVTRYCVENAIPITPGIATPTEIEMALDFDLRIVKFFPAESLGGLSTIKQLSAPYPMMRFMPTGGVSAQNVGEYLAFPKIFACGGSWMVAKELLAAKQFDRITELSAQAVQLVRKIRDQTK
jgi:2-dehydro-3-deoxyphosphogluconate aldolase/(4S)-4-hydroxy-2-oxoglutarate aldolase